MERTATSQTTTGTGDTERESCFAEGCHRRVMYKSQCPEAGCQTGKIFVLCEEHAAERMCPGCGSQLFRQPLRPVPLSHIDDGADSEDLPQDEADGAGSPCILLDLNFTLCWAMRQGSIDLGDRLEGTPPDDFRGGAGAGLHLRPHALDLLRSLLLHQKGDRCSLGFFAPWTPENMWAAVRFLLETATGAPWTQDTGSGVEAHCAQEPWEGLRVLIYDESYTETDRDGYMSKDFEKVLASWDQPLWRRLTIYITCSDECMWNGKDHLVIVHPYKHDDTSDSELSELSVYLENFLAQASDLDVRTYLRSHRFHSTAQREQHDLQEEWQREEHELQEEWQPVLQLVKEKRGLIHLPPALDSWQRKILHNIAESIGLQHESSGCGESRYLLIEFKAAP